MQENLKYGFQSQMVRPENTHANKIIETEEVIFMNMCM